MPWVWPGTLQDRGATYLQHPFGIPAGAVVAPAWGLAPAARLRVMKERLGGQAAQERYRRRRQEAIKKLVAEAEAGEGVALEEGDESEASHYREAEELARRLHGGR